jgi:uncharacterized protein YuzE
MSRPTVHYDPQSDVLYFLVQDGEEERFVEVAEGVNRSRTTGPVRSC